MNHNIKMILMIIMFIIFGNLIYLTYNNLKIQETKQLIRVEDTIQKFPIKLDNTYEIVSASVEENLLVISLKNRKTSEIYLSSLPYNELEDFVCNVQYYTYKGKNIHYNCSTKENTVYSMIKEIGLQAIEMIKEGE